MKMEDIIKYVYEAETCLLTQTLNSGASEDASASILERFGWV